MRVILFQDRFKGKVLYGSKCQTVRKSARCLPGDELSLRVWSGRPRRSKQTVLFQTVCTEVVPVMIGDRSVCFNDGRPASPQEADAFARADGFKNEDEMREWFRANHGLPFHGFVIYWDARSALRLKMLRKGIEISKSGWGGVLPDVGIVDRRAFPEAIPIARNSMFGVPDPKPLSEMRREVKAGKEMVGHE